MAHPKSLWWRLAVGLVGAAVVVMPIVVPQQQQFVRISHLPSAGLTLGYVGNCVVAMRKNATQDYAKTNLPSPVELSTNGWVVYRGVYSGIPEKIAPVINERFFLTKRVGIRGYAYQVMPQGGCILKVSSWLLAILALPLIIPLVTYLNWSFRQHRRKVKNHCPQCGYSLTGLIHARCPECGTPFQPTRSPRVKTSDEI